MLISCSRQQLLTSFFYLFFLTLRADMLSLEDHTSLLGLSLDALCQEPDLLRADASRVRRQVQETAVTQYGACLAAAACTRSVRAEVAAMQDHLAGLLGELPALASGCARFAEAAERVAAARAQNRQLLQQHGTLLDVLEAGSLLDTCVRNGSFEEALELEGIISKLAAHAPGPVCGGLKAEAHAGVRLLLATLLSRLRCGVQLPECLRCVGYLRRLAVFSEPALRLAFLRARHAWLVGLVAELDGGASGYELAKRLTDCHRGALFEVVMQYRAIFADDSAAADAAETSLVYGWAAERIASYLDALGVQVARLREGAQLAGVLEHALYCAASLGRVGLDFRGLLPPLFVPAMEAIVRRALADATAGFERSLQQHRWAAPLPVAHPIVDADSSVLTPPASLVEQAPVGAFVNGCLAALNELRHAPLPALQQPCAAALHDTLRAGAATAGRAGRNLSEAQRPLLRALQTAYVRDAAPYLSVCFERIYEGAAPLVDAQGAVSHH